MKILIVKLSAFGDIIHCLPALDDLIQHRDQEWEIDVFEGDNAGLVIAEIELEAEDQAVALPDWVGEEVTEDRRAGRIPTETCERLCALLSAKIK